MSRNERELLERVLEAAAKRLTQSKPDGPHTYYAEVLRDLSHDRSFHHEVFPR